MRAPVLARIVPIVLAVAGLALAAGMAAGAIAVPNLAEAFSDATESLGLWLYPAVAGLIFLETSVLVGFVIHGELVLLFAGVAAQRGDATIAAVVALAACAAIAGDLVSFTLGRRLGRPFLATHGTRVRLGPTQLAKIDGFFGRHGGKAIFLGRFTGYLRSTMAFAAGSSGMPLRRLLPLSILSAIVWTSVFVVIGAVFSESVTDAGDTATRIGLALVLVVTAGYVLRSRLARS